MAIREVVFFDVLFIDGSNIAFRNLILANGFLNTNGKEGAGAAIRAEGRSSINISNCIFRNNHAQGFGGGAIRMETRSFLNISEAIFENNTTDGLDIAGEISDSGTGAISVDTDSDLSIQSSTFSRNKGTDGGAINIHESHLTISNTVFFRNDVAEKGAIDDFAHGFGGALLADTSKERSETVTGDVTISETIFDRNSGIRGGSFYIKASQLDGVFFDRNVVSNNFAIANGGGGSFNGNFDSNLQTPSPAIEILNSSFINNLSSESGGALELSIFDNPMSITNSTFSANKANQFSNRFSRGGGAIFVRNGGKVLNIINSTFANNVAAFTDGAIWSFADRDISLLNTVFAYNKAGDGSQGRNHTNKAFRDAGGNIQSTELSSNETLVAEDVILLDPRLDDLKEINGLLIHPLKEGSPAIDAGIIFGAPDKDQLGNFRDDNPDIGAVEFGLD